MTIVHNASIVGLHGTYERTCTPSIGGVTWVARGDVRMDDLLVIVCDGRRYERRCGGGTLADGDTITVSEA